VVVEVDSTAAADTVAAAMADTGNRFERRKNETAGSISLPAVFDFSSSSRANCRLELYDVCAALVRAFCN